MSKTAKTRENLLHAGIFPLLIRLAIPTMIGMMIMMIYNLTDTFWIGRLNDRSMTAAVGIVFAFVSLVQAVGFWFGYGSGNYMSRCFGAGKDDEAEVYANTGVALSLAGGIVLMLVPLLFLDPLTRLLGAGASPALFEYTKTYLRIMLFAVPFAVFSTTVYNQLRLCGNIKHAMLGMMTGILANIVLDPVFILGLRMGIAGAGLATLLGQAGSCLALILISARGGSVPVSLRRCSLTREHVFHILAGGSPNFTRQGITSLASVLLNHAASAYGETLLASLTIATRVAAIGYMLAIGFGQGFQPICAMNYGAKQYGRVRKALKITVITGTLMMLAAAAVYAVFAEPLTRLFTANDEVAVLGARIIRFQCISLPFLGVYAYASMFLQNTGKYFQALLVSVLRQGIFYVPLLYVLPALFGLDGFLLLQPLADLLSAAIGIWFLLRALREMPAR